MKDEIGKSDNIILKALISLSENSLRNDHSGPSTEITPGGENTISVQPACHGLDSDQEIIDPNEYFIGAHSIFHDILHSGN